MYDEILLDMLIIICVSLVLLLLILRLEREQSSTDTNVDTGRQFEFSYFYNGNEQRGVYTISGGNMTVSTGFGTKSARTGGLPDVMLAKRLAIELASSPYDWGTTWPVAQ